MPRRGARLASACLAVCFAGCSPLHDAPLSELDDAVATAAADGEAPGLVVAAVDTESTTYAFSGDADPAKGLAAGPDTVFMLFSVSKVFTATAIVQLEERGLLDLDDPVADYLDDFSFRNPFPRELRLRHLLSHTSGLRDPNLLGMVRPADERATPLEEQLEVALATHGRLHTEPGRRQSYSNVGFLALGVVVERVSGRRFDQYVTENIFEPLAMTRSGFAYVQGWGDDVAVGHVERGTLQYRLGRRMVDPAIFGPDRGEFATANRYSVHGHPYGGMLSCARDLGRFAQALLRGGELDGRRILEDESVRRMLQPARDRSGRELAYGHGWHHGRAGGERYMNHLGRGGGFRPELRIYPELGYAVVVLASRSKFDTRPMSQTRFAATKEL